MTHGFNHLLHVAKINAKRNVVFVATLNKRFEQLILLVLVKSSMRISIATKNYNCLIKNLLDKTRGYIS